MAATKRRKPKTPTYTPPAGVQRIVAADVSLTASGLAEFQREPGGGWTCTNLTTVKTTGRGCARLEVIAASFAFAVRGPYYEVPTVGVIEGPSYASVGHQHEMGGAWWTVARLFHQAGVPLAVMSPHGRAKYATGKAGADKDAVLISVLRRFAAPDYAGPDPADNNQADALVLAAAIADAAGAPIVKVPLEHREALEGISLL